MMFTHHSRPSSPRISNWVGFSIEVFLSFSFFLPSLFSVESTLLAHQEDPHPEREKEKRKEMEARLLEKVREQASSVDLASGTDLFALAVHASLLSMGLTYIGGEYSEGCLLPSASSCLPAASSISFSPSVFFFFERTLGFPPQLNFFFFSFFFLLFSFFFLFFFLLFLKVFMRDTRWGLTGASMDATP